MPQREPALLWLRDCALTALVLALCTLTSWVGSRCGMGAGSFPLQGRDCGKAGKKQIQEMSRIMLHLQTIPKPDDTADALAMAVAHCHCSRSRLMGTAPR